MIIFFYGADSYRSRQKLNELKEKFINEIDPASQSLITVNGASTTLKEISDKINTGSLFVKKRMVIIEDIFDNKSDKLLGELEIFLKSHSESKNTDEENIIIFRDGDINSKNSKLKKEAKKLLTYLLTQKYVQEFKVLTGSSLHDFAQQEVTKLGRKINTSAINLLIARTNSDLWRIASELHKLALMINEKEEINEQLVKDNVAGVFDEDIFALTDALSARNSKKALDLLERQYLAGVSEDYVLAMLIRQFKILLQIKSAVEANLSATAIASELKLHPYVVKKGLTQVSAFSLGDLKNKLNNLISIDFANKTGQSETKAELALFLIKL
jgi:DNA polymerase-3 subunit delta